MTAGIFHDFFLKERKFHEENSMKKIFHEFENFMKISWFQEKENSMKKLFHDRKFPERQFHYLGVPWKKISWFGEKENSMKNKIFHDRKFP